MTAVSIANTRRDTTIASEYREIERIDKRLVTDAVGATGQPRAADMTKALEDMRKMHQGRIKRYVAMSDDELVREFCPDLAG